MEIGEIISKKVSFQPNAWSSIDKEMIIGDVIKDIKGGKYSDDIGQLRYFLKENDIEKYDIYKKRLPGVTFCANFSTQRKKELIKEYNRIIVIDIDKLDGSELNRVKGILKQDEYVFSFWVSPSEKGIKGLIYLNYRFPIEKFGIDFSHRNAFQQITEYFKTKYSIDLDISGSDTTRLCFFSYDSALVFKKTIIPFEVSEPELVIQEKEDSTVREKKQLKTTTKIQYLRSRDVLYNPTGKNDHANRKTIVRIIKYLKKNRISITNSYEEWYRVAYAIATSFTFDIGERYYLSLCELDGVKHDEIQSKNMLLYCYNNNKGTITFNTLIFFAKSKGFII